MSGSVSITFINLAACIVGNETCMKPSNHRMGGRGDRTSYLLFSSVSASSRSPMNDMGM